jgi:uncharacterized repeat protein (TIGR01451 family)
VGGVTVTLRQDTDGNGSFETAAAVQLTAADGSYEFANLPVGRYQVVVTVPAGQNPTTPIAVVADLSGGEVIDTADFGLRSTPAPVGSIGDTVWNDGNGNGVQDPGELGLENVTVTLLRDGDGDGVYETPVGSDITDAAGTYGFGALPPGSYRVVVTPPGGFSPTSPPVIGVELSGGEVVTDADFGLDDVAVVPGTIGDRVWSDTDRDGVQDAGEPGLNGVTVTLLRDGNGDGTYETTVSSTVTAGDGGYGFTFVPPGAYLVVVTAPPGQSPTTPAAIVVNLATAQDVTDADVGMATPPTVPFDLALTKSLEGQLRNGDPATWLIEVTNNGIVASPNPVTVVDVLPTGLTYTGFTGTGWSCSAAGSTVTCTLPESIPVGATRQLRITTQVALAAGTRRGRGDHAGEQLGSRDRTGPAPADHHHDGTADVDHHDPAGDPDDGADSAPDVDHHRHDHHRHPAGDRLGHLAPGPDRHGPGDCGLGAGPAPPPPHPLRRPSPTPLATLPAPTPAELRRLRVNS